MDIQLQYSVAGLLVGMLVGLTGTGGGSLMAPLLIIFFGVKPVVAVGTDLVYMSLTKLFGALQHHRQGNVDYKLAILLATGSIPGAILGILSLLFLSDYVGFSLDDLITHLMAFVILITGMGVLFFRRAQSINKTLRTRYTRYVPVIGVLVGFLVAVTSVGSGALFLVLIVALYALPMKRVVGTDVFHGFILVSIAGFAHTIIGNVDFALVASLLIGSVPGVLIGSQLTGLMNERKLGVAVGVALLGVGVSLML